MTILDVVVANASIIDGTVGAVATPGDIGVSNGTIEVVGDLSNRNRSRTIDARGMVVAPGFIDSHTHGEMAAFIGRDESLAPISQGITTTLLGADGFGWVGLEPDMRARWWEDTAAIYGPPPDALPSWSQPSDFMGDIRRGSATAVVAMIPHNNVRAAAMGASRKRPDPAEMRAMHEIVDAWLAVGAVGMATGLDYLPGRFADTDELVELCERVAESGGVYASHIRLLDSGRAEAWREAAEIGSRSGAPVRIAHERLDEEGLSLLDEVSSWDVTIDSYLYPAGCTSLAFHVPPELLLDGVMSLVERLRGDPGLANELADTLDPKLDGGPGKRVIVAGTTSGRYEGQTIGSIATERGVSPGRVGVDLLIEEMPSVVLIYAWQDPDASWDNIMKETLNHQRTLIASDGIYFGAFAHPRGFGTFPRVLGQVSRDKNLAPLATAIHKMTGKPAEAYGLSDRGQLTPGRRADLVMFDPTTIAGADDFANPREQPQGIEMVMVGGVMNRKEEQ